jgi:hypothetical protein
VEMYPTIQFDTLATGSLNSQVFPMSTFVQYGTTLLSSPHQTLVAGVTAQPGYSNIFQQPMKFNIPTSNVQGAYQFPYVLYHTLPNSVAYQISPGFKSGDVSVFFPSTNSYFLTIQNLSF